jgi:broad specificity phosphatase PhoE
MRALLVRHYKTRSNVEREVTGWSESPPAANWQADVNYVADILHNASIDFDSVYTSELCRARNTGQFYAQRLKIADVRAAAELNEIDYGKISRRKKRWVEKHVPGHKTDPDMVYEGGESFHQMQRRATRFVTGLARERPEQTLLLVVHAGVIRGLVSHFLGLDYGPQLKRRVTHRYLGDLRFDGERCTGYNELGRPSGFADPQVLELPWSAD